MQKTDVQRKGRAAKVKIQYMENKQNYHLQITETSALVLGKWAVAKIHSYVSFTCKRCFLSFHLKVKVEEDLIHSGIEDHTFGPTNLREHFPEEELTLIRNRLLEDNSLVTCGVRMNWADWNKIVIWMLWKQFVVVRAQEFSHW